MWKWQAYGERIRVSPLNPGECGLAMTQRYIEGDTEAKRKLVALL